MKYVFILIAILSTISPLSSHGEDKRLKLVAYEHEDGYRVPVLYVTFSGEEWVFTSGDFTNQPFRVMFDEIRKADKQKHVINGFKLIISNKYSMEDASSIYYLMPCGFYYITGIFFEDSDKDIESDLFSYFIEHYREAVQPYVEENKDNSEDPDPPLDPSVYESLLPQYYQQALNDSYAKLKLKYHKEISNQGMDPTESGSNF